MLADQGRSDYCIVIAEKAPPTTRFAAGELQNFLKEISGADLPVVTDNQPPKKHEILLGNSSRPESSPPGIGFEKLGDEGYLLRTTGDRLVITGAAPRGTLYGVYGLLEDHLGCRWFTPQTGRIPKRQRLEIGPLDETRVPALEYREVMIFDCQEPDWYARNRLNTTKLVDGQRGGSFKYVPGYYVHTFGSLVPAGTYFDTHPEYFSEVGGKRLREANQLCPTNEDVIRIVTERVRDLFRQHPDARVISVSQNDSDKNYCQCPVCAALDEKEGTHAAQVLYLVNAVAAAIEKEFPDKAVETLAYEWSRRPPKTMQPRANVIIRLSTIRCSFSEPLSTSGAPANRGFRRDLEGWAGICSRLWIWDYVTNFSYYLLPFPNHRVMDDNMRFFAKNHVRGVVEQGNWQSPHGAMSGLTAYLAAKYLWNPGADQEQTTLDYLEGVYGPAAKPIKAYLDLLADKVETEQIPLPIYGSRVPPYLTVDLMEKADALWNEAELLVSTEPGLLRRVRLARLSPDYAIIEHYHLQPGEMIRYEGNPRRGKVAGIDPSLEARVRRFLEVFESSGVTHIREGKPDSADYITWLKSLLPPETKPGKP